MVPFHVHGGSALPGATPAGHHLYRIPVRPVPATTLMAALGRWGTAARVRTTHAP